MKDKIEKRLARDAQSLDALEMSEEAGQALASRLAATRQVAPTQAVERPGWQPLAAAAAALVAVVAVALLLPREQAETPAPVATTTVPEPIRAAPGGLRLGERLPLEAVSQTEPLEQEWVALRDDLERAREQIERELPVRF